MTIKTILRTTLATVLALTLVAAPVAAAAPDRPAETDQAIWSTELGDLLTRAWGLLFGERAGGEREGLQSVAAADECESDCESDAGSEMDPDG